MPTKPIPMTPESRAKEALLAETENREGGLPQINWYSLHKRIASAIRSAENDKLEEAARLCDGVTEELKPGRRQSHASPYFAALIRSLKSKDAP